MEYFEDSKKLHIKMLQVLLDDCNSKAILFADAISKISKAERKEDLDSAFKSVEITLSNMTKERENELTALQNGFAIEQMMKEFCDLLGGDDNGE